MHDSQPFRRPMAGGLLLLVLVAAAAALLALPRTAAATNPCDNDPAPDYCFDTAHGDTGRESDRLEDRRHDHQHTCRNQLRRDLSGHRQQSRSCDYYDCGDWTYPSYTST